MSVCTECGVTAGAEPAFVLTRPAIVDQAKVVDILPFCGNDCLATWALKGQDVPPLCPLGHPHCELETA